MNRLFDLPSVPLEGANVSILPVPWEPTTSYQGGTSRGPSRIVQASHQLDLFDSEFGDASACGIHLHSESRKIFELSQIGRNLIRTKSDEAVKKVNAFSKEVNEIVSEKSKETLHSEKILGILGGDHSSPFGAIQAAAEHYERQGGCGILHLDAHMDLRRAYQGFEHSHASIMYNVCEHFPISKLVQVGIRDFCEEEWQYNENNPIITTFLDSTLNENRFQGKSWESQCNEIIENLPRNIWISFDVDGLDPRFCPNTGTPVPGGLDFRESVFLLKKLVQSNRKIVGFDLCEVSCGETNDPNAGEWDANVGMRLLYQLCGWALKSWGKL